MATNPNSFTPGTWRPKSAIEIVTRVTPSLVDAKGNLTPYTAVAQFFDEVEIRTKVTPPIKLNIRNLDAPGTNPILDKLKPAFILRGPIGTKVVAPYGELPTAEEGIANAEKLIGVGVGTILFVGGLGFLLGELRQKIKAKRRARGA